MIRGVEPAPPGARLPDGAVVALDATTRVLAGGGILLGGRPRRMLRLHASVRPALIGRRLVVTDLRTALVARRLLDSGLGHPYFPAHPAGHRSAVTAYEAACGAGRGLDIVIPVRDRPRELARLLDAIRADPETAAARVIVVDDGSREAGRTAMVASGAGADLVRHRTARGPAAARNTGLAAGSAPTVAFLDSDCVPVPGWFGRLFRHLHDPAVALAAPRIVAGTFPPARRARVDDGSGRRTGRRFRRAGHGWLADYERVASSLDLGPDQGRVAPGLPVSYVPSAALLARRCALGSGFDEAMAVAEDVDLVWRLAGAGWTVRYEPGAEVAHEHRSRIGDFLARRAYYGSGAALLAQRHGATVAPVVVAPWTALTVLGVVVGRRWSLGVSAAAAAVSTIRLAQTMAAAHVPSPLPMAADLVWRGSVSAGRSMLRPVGREYWPVALGAGLRWSSLRRRVLLVVAADAVLAWWPHRRTSSPAGLLAGRRLEDLAYGTGVWYGALRTRSLAALRPRVARRPAPK